jgi:hypothetical protein
MTGFLLTDAGALCQAFGILFNEMVARFGSVWCEGIGGLVFPVLQSRLFYDTKRRTCLFSIEWPVVEYYWPSGFLDLREGVHQYGCAFEYQPLGRVDHTID